MHNSRCKSLGAAIRVVSILLILLTGCRRENQTSHSRAQATPPAQKITERNRAQFVEAIQRVKPGMSPDEVRRILGEPDDVRTEVDLPPGHWSRPFIDWNYGTSGHNTFPMLGIVSFEDGKVRTHSDYIDSDQDDDDPRPPRLPPHEDVIKEPELRQLLAKIHSVVDCFESSSQYDPLPVVQAVNALQSAGTAKAFASLKEYARLRDEPSYGTTFGFECLLKAVFDTGGAIPEPLGLWTDANDLIATPQHPLNIIDGIPFVIAKQGGTTGSPPELLETLHFYEQFGQIRAAQLIPTNRPIEALQKLIVFELADSHEPTAEHENNVREEYLPQIRMLIRSAHPLPFDENGKPYAWVVDCDGVEAPRVQGEIEQLEIRWDATQQVYVRSDGTHVPDAPPLNRPRAYWKPTSLDVLGGQFTLKRSTLDHIWLLLEWEWPAVHSESQFVVQFSCDGTPLLEFQIPRPRPMNPFADKFDDLCRHITPLSNRVGSISEMNDNPVPTWHCRTDSQFELAYLTIAVNCSNQESSSRKHASPKLPARNPEFIPAITCPVTIEVCRHRALHHSAMTFARKNPEGVL